MKCLPNSVSLALLTILSPAQATVFVLTDVMFADYGATASGYFVMEHENVTAWDIQTSDLTHFSDRNLSAKGQAAEKSFLSFDAQHHPVVNIGRPSGEIHLATLADMSAFTQPEPFCLWIRAPCTPLQQITRIPLAGRCRTLGATTSSAAPWRLCTTTTPTTHPRVQQEGFPSLKVGRGFWSGRYLSDGFCERN